jgi:hypothetical protein
MVWRFTKRLSKRLIASTQGDKMTIKAILIDSKSRTLSYVDVPAEIPPTPAGDKAGGLSARASNR